MIRQTRLVPDSSASHLIDLALPLAAIFVSVRLQGGKHEDIEAPAAFELQCSGNHSACATLCPEHSQLTARGLAHAYAQIVVRR